MKEAAEEINVSDQSTNIPTLSKPQVLIASALEFLWMTSKIVGCCCYFLQLL